MPLRNRAFQAQTEAAARRKLETALRTLTKDRLTARQRQLIVQAAGVRRQYCIQLCPKGTSFPGTADAGRKTVTRHIFGSVRDWETQPAAVLIRQKIRGGTVNTIRIYLPAEREEHPNDT